jgi:hypothetical protein
MNTLVGVDHRKDLRIKGASMEMTSDRREWKKKTSCTPIRELHTHIPFTLYILRGSRGISDIPSRGLGFTKII